MRSSLRLVSQTLVVPQGFTLSIAGTLATLVGERGYPGAFGIWLFVLAAGLAFCWVVGGAGLHRDPEARPDPITGRATFNLAPAAVVPCVYWLQKAVGNDRLAFLLSGFVAVALYLVVLAASVSVNGRCAGHGTTRADAGTAAASS
jgi:hypothetical protein